jgi:two-component system KDP operon response regulator KdpE
MDPLKILLIDNDPEFVELLSLALLGAGLLPVPSFSATQALDSLATDVPVLAILNVPNGHEHRLDVLKALRVASDVLILVLAGPGSVEHEVRAFELGADAVLSKPFGVHQLLARVGALLRARAWRQASTT